MVLPALRPAVRGRAVRPHPHLVGTPVASLGRLEPVCTWWLPSVCSKGVGDCVGGDGVARLRAMQLGVCESFKRAGPRGGVGREGCAAHVTRASDGTTGGVRVDRKSVV